MNFLSSDAVRVNHSSSEILSEVSLPEEFLDSMLLDLKNINPKLIELSPWKIQKIVQRWSVVQRSYNYAQILGKKCILLRMRKLKAKLLNHITLSIPN